MFSKRTPAPQRALGLIPAGLIVGLSMVCVATTPVASARSLQAIYADMVAQDSKRPCKIAEPSNLDCKQTVIPKVKLANEAALILRHLPAPPGGPTDVALDNIRSITSSADKWDAAHCFGSPSFVDKITTCDGSFIQEMFSGLTTNVGTIVRSS